MDGITMLKEDHKRVKRLMAEIEKLEEESPERRKRLFAELERELRIHEDIEEKILYPAFKKKEALKDIVLEGYEEHHVVNLVLAEIEGVALDDERWQAKFAVAKENVEHHIEEEEGEMFKKARQEFSRAELQELGERMEQRKQQDKMQLPKAS